MAMNDSNSGQDTQEDQEKGGMGTGGMNNDTNTGNTTQGDDEDDT